MTIIYDHFDDYLQTIGAELNSVRNRIRLLVKHWPTDGHFKEALLRNLLRRYLPERYIVGTGFIVSAAEVSKEIDILIVDRNMPTLFKEGELLLVTPEAVRAVIEVKTSLKGKRESLDAMIHIAEIKKVATSHVAHKNVWAGLFVYDVYKSQKNFDIHLLEIAHSLAGRRDEQTVDCIAFGQNDFLKFFPAFELERFDRPANAWHSMHTPLLAPSLFIASLIEALVPPATDHGTFFWSRMPRSGTNRNYVIRDWEGVVKSHAEWFETRSLEVKTEDPRPDDQPGK